VRLLTGVTAPTSGEIKVLGNEPSRFNSSMRLKLGYMPQLFVLYPNLSVWENLNFVASMYGMPWRRKKRLNEILEFVELKEHKRKLTRDISGGMQRRLSLASTLVTKPELAFLDEPTAGIDPVLRRKFWDHFRQLREEGRTLFVTTQYVNEAAYCDKVGVLAEGRLIALDTPENLRQLAYGGDVVELISEEPLNNSQVRRLGELPFVLHKPKRVAADDIRLIVKDAKTNIAEIVRWCEAQQIDIRTVEKFVPDYDDVFVKLVEAASNE
jgi:ABC-2 type transport system ATP-binding protein